MNELHTPVPQRLSQLRIAQSRQLFDPWKMIGAALKQLQIAPAGMNHEFQPGLRRLILQHLQEMLRCRLIAMITIQPLEITVTAQRQSPFSASLLVRRKISSVGCSGAIPPTSAIVSV